MASLTSLSSGLPRRAERAGRTRNSYASFLDSKGFLASSLRAFQRLGNRPFKGWEANTNVALKGLIRPLRAL